MQKSIWHNNYALDAVIDLPEAKQSEITIIISHGFRGSKDGGGRAVVFAQQLKKYFNVVRFDFSPLGSLTNQVQELHSVINYVQQNMTDKIILFGRSMGACASLVAQGQNKNIVGLILWSMPFDLKSTFANALGKDNLAKMQQGLDITLDDQWGVSRLKASFYQDLLNYDIKSNLEKLPKQLPVLFVQAKLDEIIAKEDFKEEFRLCAANNKTLCFIEAADHRFINGFDEALAGVLTWLSRTYK